MAKYMNKKNKANKSNKNNFKSSRSMGVVNTLPNFPNSRQLPLPLTVRTKLRYADTFVLASSSGLASYQYSGNSAYDPDITSVGHQPLYWDTYASVYKKYVVLSSRITIKYQVDTGSNQCIISALAASYLNTFAVTMAGIDEAIESPFCKYKVLVNNPTKEEVLTLGYKTYEMLNVSESELLNNPTFWADTTSDPTNEWKYNLLFSNMDATVTSFGIALQVLIEYDVLFGQFAEVAPSLKNTNVPRRRTGRPLEKVCAKVDEKIEILEDNTSQSSLRSRRK